MEFGIFHEFETLAGHTQEDAFEHAFKLVDAAEQWGLDAVWLAELHFSPQRSVLSAPLTIAGAVAARTRRIKIGTAVQVLPLHHPLRLAEETATIDHISQGRLIFGVGRSGFATTYQRYGVPYGESRERFAEALDIVIKAWTLEQFSYHGRYHQFDDLTVVPKPFQQPHPPVRIAATSPDTFPNCGELGYPIFAAVRLGTLSELGPNIGEYRKAFKQAGHQGPGEVFLRVPVYVAETDAEARTVPEDSIMGFYRMLGRQLEQSAGEAGARTIEDRAGRGQRLQSITWPDVMRDKVIVGTAARVADRLCELQAELGINGILAELNCGGTIPRQQVFRSLQLLCEQVMPRVS